MFTIKENLENKIIINKSIFITKLIKIKNVNDFNEKMKEIKNEYKYATHYCYAYIIDNYKKESDDGEPKGTAGIPIIETLDKFKLNYVLCVVIRYFGGIKLGAGGLIRAYRKSVSNVLNSNKEKIIELIDGCILRISIPYNQQKKLEKLLDCSYCKTYNEMVNYTIECSNYEKEILEKKYKIDILKTQKIEKS